MLFRYDFLRIFFAATEKERLSSMSLLHIYQSLPLYDFMHIFNLPMLPLGWCRVYKKSYPAEGAAAGVRLYAI
jgi:hypothetical protein